MANFEASSTPVYQSCELTYGTYNEVIYALAIIGDYRAVEPLKRTYYSTNSLALKERVSTYLCWIGDANGIAFVTEEVEKMDFSVLGKARIYDSLSRSIAFDALERFAIDPNMGDEEKEVVMWLASCPSQNRVRNKRRRLEEDYFDWLTSGMQIAGIDQKIIRLYGSGTAIPSWIICDVFSICRLTEGVSVLIEIAEDPDEDFSSKKQAVFTLRWR